MGTETVANQADMLRTERKARKSSQSHRNTKIFSRNLQGKVIGENDQMERKVIGKGGERWKRVD